MFKSNKKKRSRKTEKWSIKKLHIMFSFLFFDCVLQNKLLSSLWKNIILLNNDEEYQKR